MGFNSAFKGLIYVNQFFSTRTRVLVYILTLFKYVSRIILKYNKYYGGGNFLLFPPPIYTNVYNHKHKWLMRFDEADNTARQSKQVTAFALLEINWSICYGQKISEFEVKTLTIKNNNNNNNNNTKLISDMASKQYFIVQKLGFNIIKNSLEECMNKCVWNLMAHGEA
jgi:hypothetical protein